MRTTAVRLARRAISEGAKWCEVYRRLGISEPTLRSWLKESALRQVEIIPDPSPSLRLVVGRGFVDLSPDQLAGLLWGTR